MQFYDENKRPIKVCNCHGEEISVVPTLQAIIESLQEIKRAERLRKFCISELAIIALLLLTILFKGEIWEQLRQ